MKLKTIREIRNCGLEVIFVIQRWGMDDDTAKEVEAALIDTYFGLTNRVKGNNSGHGVCNAEWLEDKFKKEEYKDAPSNPPYIMIKIHWSTVDWVKGYSFDERLYNATRGQWNISRWEAEHVYHKYCLSVINGVVKEVYKIDNWVKVLNSKRFEFNGSIAETNIRNLFIDKKIPSVYKTKGNRCAFLYSKKHA